MERDFLRVLVAEDEALTAMAVEDALSALGHEMCWTARSGPEAVELARRHNPDLVTMDGVLANGTSGLTAAADISTTLGIPVIMISGSVSEQEAILAGALSAVSKPFTTEDIAAAIHKATALHTGGKLPLLKKDLQPGQSEIVLSSATKPASSSPILIVEDDPRDVDLVLSALEETGCATPVTVARDGQSALRLLLENGEDGSGPLQPSVMFLDVRLTGGTGTDVLVHIRADQRTRALPVVMLADTADTPTITACY